MKIVIEIDEEVKHKVYAYGLSLCPRDKEQLIHAIMNGVPLDDVLIKIRDEIAAIYPDDYPCNMRIPERIRDMAVEIVEKYIGDDDK